MNNNIHNIHYNYELIYDLIYKKVYFSVTANFKFLSIGIEKNVNKYRHFPRKCAKISNVFFRNTLIRKSTPF